jgi:hypothetical protein
MIKYFWIAFYFFKNLFSDSKPMLGKSEFLKQFARINGYKFKEIKLSKVNPNDFHNEV